MHRVLKLSAILFICALAAAHAVRADDEEVDESDVLILTKENFDSVVNQEELMLVEFYAPWCGHCKHLKPHYARAAALLKANDPPIKLAKVDATAETDLASRFEVHGYPTLFVMRNGKKSEYKGPRETNGIVSYLKKQVGPAAKPLSSKEDIEQFIAVGPNTRDYVVVGYLPDTSSQLYAAFMMVAGRMRDDFVFGVVTNPALCLGQGYEQEAVVAYKNYDDKKTIFGGKKSKELEDWVLKHSFPLVGNFVSDKAPLYQRRGLPLAKYYMRVDPNPANEKHNKYFTSRLQQIATAFEDKVLFMVADAQLFAHELEAFGWKDKQNEKTWEGGLVVEKDRQKFKYDGKFATAAMKQFVTNVLAGSVEPFIKSEPIPTSNDGPVKVVVGKTFNEIVLDESKDVMIELYAPWCGHCKALAPKYEKLAKKLESASGLVIAKMDATANDAPAEFEVRGYPTLYFKPAGTKKPMKYEGEREVDDMVKFIKKNAKNAVDVKKKSKKDL